MMKNRKAPILTLGMITVLTAGLFTACGGEKSVDYTIEGQVEEGQEEGQADEEQPQSEGGKSGLAQFEGEEKWKDTWMAKVDEYESEGQMLDITTEVRVDAEIILPQAREMSVVEVVETEFDTEFKERVVKAIFDGEEVYYHDEEHIPKSELEELYAMYEEWYMTANTDSSRENMKEEMEECAKLIENASDSYTPAVDYEVNEYIGEINGITYELSFSEFYGETGLNINSKRIDFYAADVEEYCPDKYDGYTRYMAHPYMTCDRYTEVGENECGISQKEAEELASDMLKELGLEYPVLAYTKPLIWGDETLSTENIYDWPANGYVFTFEYGLDDVSFTSFGTNYDYYNLMNSTEDEIPQYSLMASADVYVTDKGIISLYAASPVETEGISENVKLLPLNTIKEIIKEEMAKRYEEFRFEYIEAENQLEFTYMELIYFRISDKENAGCYTYIPAWRLSSQIGDIVQNNRSIRNAVIINAIDGTLISAYDEM